MTPLPMVILVLGAMEGETMTLVRRLLTELMNQGGKPCLLRAARIKSWWMESKALL